MASIPTSGKNAKVNFFGAHGHCKECMSRDKSWQWIYSWKGVNYLYIYGKVLISHAKWGKGEK